MKPYNVEVSSNTDITGILIRKKVIGNFDDFTLKYTAHKDIDENGRGQTTIYCDFESGEWNYRQFIDWFGSHLPMFALSSKELKDLSDKNMVDKLERAAGIIYGLTDTTETRGEIGELILHGLIRDIYKTTPLVSKIYYKTAPNDTVKGADCVHVISDGKTIESLWLGESKFYSNGDYALADAIASIRSFIKRLQNREEFIAIRHHLDKDDTIGIAADKLLSTATSLDEIKAKIIIPVLITYDSDVTKSSASITVDFVKQLNAEVEPYLTTFFRRMSKEKEIDIHLFCMPLKDKNELSQIVNQFISTKKSIF